MSSPKKAFTKTPKSPTQTLALLKERGLSIADEERAVKYLTHIGYYRLSAYFIPFEKPAAEAATEHELKAGTTFGQVLQLYIFDRKLRILVMEAIERIEVSLRTNWANVITLEVNDAHAYMDATLFRDPWKHQQNLAKAAGRLKGSKETFIQHYKSTYQQPFMPPTWAMAETLTFGELSQWFENTEGIELKKVIIKELGFPPAAEVAETVIQCLALIRNICAHHGRLWNRKLVKQLPHIKRLAKHMVFDEIESGGEVQRQASRRLFNYLVVINHLMRAIQPTTSWSQRLDELIESLSPVHQVAMGIPSDWQGFDKQQQNTTSRNKVSQCNDQPINLS